MPKINFFKAEVIKLQDKFTDVVGSENVFRTDASLSIMLSICRLGLLAEEISKPHDKYSVKEKVREFIRITNKTNGLLDRIKHERSVSDASKRDGKITFR